ncbi:hypothetical protein D3C77_390360 [compost metagenome]
MLLDLVVVLDVVRVAWFAVVATAYLPLAGSAVVGDRVIAVAVTEVNNLVDVVFRLVVEHRTARTGAVAVRVPVEVGVEAPVAVEAVGVLQRVRRYIRLGVITGFPVNAWKLDLAVLEVQCLANTECLALEAVFFNPAVGYAQRQLVFVANTVDTGEAVITEQRAVIERALARVEDWNILLVFIGHIQVVEARFQGLAIVFPEPLSVTVEVQAAVYAENGHIAILRAFEVTLQVYKLRACGRQVVLAFTVQIKIVMSGHILDRRRQVTVGRGKRQANFRCCVQAGAVCAGKTEYVFVKPFATNDIARCICNSASSEVWITILVEN